MAIFLFLSILFFSDGKTPGQMAIFILYYILMAITLLNGNISVQFYSFLMAMTLVKWRYLYSILFQSFLFYKSVCMKFVFVSDVVKFSSISSVKKPLASDRRRLY